MKKILIVASSFVLVFIFSSSKVWADDWSFTTVPSDGKISGKPGSTVGWGYKITNNSKSNWLVISSMNTNIFKYGEPIDIFDYPILQPSATAEVHYDNDKKGLYKFKWDKNAPFGFSDTGHFTLSADYYDGDPLNGGNLISSAGDKESYYMISVENVENSAKKTWWEKVIKFFNEILQNFINFIKKLFEGADSINNKNSELNNQNVNSSLNNNPISQSNNKIVVTILNTMKSGKKDKCIFHNSDKSAPDQTMTIYIENKKYRLETVTPITPENKSNAIKSTVINDGEMQYHWTDGYDNSTKSSYYCLKGVIEKNGTKKYTRDDFLIPDWFKRISGDITCEEINSIDFAIPKDINFIDSCEDIKNKLQK